jgi:type IV secretion system protein VirD4
MQPSNDDQVVATLVLVGIAMLFLVRRRRWRGSGTAFGTASFMSEKLLKASGMLSRQGLVLGRTFSGMLIRLPNYCHVLCCGGSGSGKGVSIVLPNLLTYSRGSIICFDTKGDLFQTAAGQRARNGDRIVLMAPFLSGNTDGLNPLDTIPRDSLMLVDSARAMAEALVVRLGTESDPHWNAKAVQLITAVLVLVLLRFQDEDRTLNTVQEIISDPELLRASVQILQSFGGIPARLGAQHGNAAPFVFGFRSGGKVAVKEHLRSFDLKKARHHPVSSDSARSARGTEGLAPLLGLNARPPHRRCRQ